MIIDHLFPPAPESEPETKHDHHWIIDGLYTYRSSDFNGQDYKLGTGILTGDFCVPLKNSSGMPVGMISWGCIAQPKTADYKSEHLHVLENMTISIGLDNNTHTCHGSNLSVSSGGFYEEGTIYKFCVSGCPGEDAIVTIRNVGNEVREVAVERGIN
jgi:hypothetical protein